MPRQQPSSWSDVKARLTQFDRAGLIGPVGGVEIVGKANQTRAAGFCNDIGLQNDGYVAALERMFSQALGMIAKLPVEEHSALLQGLDEVRRVSHDVGYGIDDELDDLLFQHTRIKPR